jgi:PAS domain S-box-containing protein
MSNGISPHSESELRALTDAAPAILWITDADGNCSFVSPGWCQHTGQTEKEALGAGWLQQLHPDDREDARRRVSAAMLEREPFDLDYRLRTASGEYRWSLSSARPRVSPSGEFEGFAASVIDIHDRKEAARTAALLSAIVDSSDDAIISKNLEGIIMSWNRAAERLFGYTAAEAIGRPITILIPPGRLDEEPRILERLRRGERVDHFETIRLRKDGTPLNISLTISPVKDSNQRVIGASKIARDITERVRQEEALRQANEDLQQFAHSASHDLQEPLRMVAVYSQLLQETLGGEAGGEVSEYTDHIVKGAKRMATLLGDLRAYLQVSADEEADEDIDAGEVLQRVLVNLEVAIRDSAATVESSPLPRVRIRRFQLEQVFQNLIANGIRYRSVAPPQIRIAASYLPHERKWKFSVQDNGIGIEAEYYWQIFGVFKRLHSHSQIPGAGMGLAICKRIVERTGGKIWVESEPGQGATFHFTLPGKP